MNSVSIVAAFYLGSQMDSQALEQLLGGLHFSAVAGAPSASPWAITSWQKMVRAMFCTLPSLTVQTFVGGNLVKYHIIAFCIPWNNGNEQSRGLWFWDKVLPLVACGSTPFTAAQKKRPLHLSSHGFRRGTCKGRSRADEQNPSHTPLRRCCDPGSNLLPFESKIKPRSWC